MSEFWRRVSNVLELVIYWKRYESFEGCSLATGDLSVTEAIPLVRMQKLIEATEMNSNREYAQIIDPSKCYRSYHPYPSLDTIENEVDTPEMNEQFEKRMQKLVVSNEKFEKISALTHLNSYDLFLHKALILSLNMISYFDSEKWSGYYDEGDTYENCCLISQGLFSKDSSDSKALGLMIDMNQDQDFTQFNQVASNYIAISIVLNEWNYRNFAIPDHVQYLCFQFGRLSYFYEGSELYANFLSEQEVFPNVRDLTIRMDTFLDDSYWDFVKTIENNIISGINRKRFPKLVRLSLQGFSLMDNLMELDILSELPYVEIISHSKDYNFNVIPNWSQRRVHDFIKHRFLEKDSLIHHFITHANINRLGQDADYESIKEFYDLSLGKFVASISHSSIAEYYTNCSE
ncbi:predicted protein [Naegleria gruberi]|uniref:Predicted protein n=1 Tax=Naegleria gruberi TaxID=5762 RepID=D2VPF6_NAEGR|nr:uncharacterized protein NAEGRDRAFT_70843 [Naegleria gruberi]EFC41421.1 predicted protein [Naegleria gruberi]|eukprot:XP_002674165.1 predicted protein [Naegleria gruberi strain NEG-M]